MIDAQVGRRIPNFFIRARRVLSLRPSCSAALPRPLTFQSQDSSTAVHVLASSADPSLAPEVEHHSAGRERHQGQQGRVGPLLSKLGHVFEIPMWALACMAR